MASEHRGDCERQHAQHDDYGQDSGHRRGHGVASPCCSGDSEAEIQGDAKLLPLRQLRIIDGGKRLGPNIARQWILPDPDDDSLDARIRETLAWAAVKASGDYQERHGREPTDHERRFFAMQIGLVAHGSEMEAALLNNPGPCPGAA